MAPQLKKRLGQHHLHQGTLCRPLVDFLRPDGCRVVEIGPGGGVLTRELLDAGAQVVAWELDLAWALHVGRELAAGALRIVVGDALDLAWERLRAGSLVTGNLPYGIASNLIHALLWTTDRVPRAAFLVQREVAERLTAAPGSPAYASASVLVRARAEARILARVARGSFRPPPKVDGAFVGLLMEHPTLDRREWTGFSAVVRAAFAQRRKTLRNSLAAAWGRGRAEGVLAAAGIDGGRRAQDLDLAEFLSLWRSSGGPG